MRYEALIIPGISIEKWSAFLIVGSQYQLLDCKHLFQRTVKEILSQPYVFRLESPTKVYYVSNQDAYLNLQEKGKHPSWLHDLLEELRLQRYPDASIYEWPLAKVFADDSTGNSPESSYAVLLESPQYGNVWIVPNEQERIQLNDGLPAVLTSEVEFLQEMNPEAIKKVFLVKKQFPGAKLREFKH